MLPREVELIAMRKEVLYVADGPGWGGVESKYRSPDNVLRSCRIVVFLFDYHVQSVIRGGRRRWGGAFGRWCLSG